MSSGVGVEGLQSQAAVKPAAVQGQALSVQKICVESAEDLREAVRGADIEIVQLRAGLQQGSLAHYALGDASLSLCDFSIEVRARGILSLDKLVLGTLLASAGDALFWGDVVSPGDLVIFPAGTEADAIYHSGMSYAGLTIDPSELASLFNTEGALADPAAWMRRGVRRAEPLLKAEVTRRLTGIGSNLQRYGGRASPQALDFVRRSIIETFAAGLIRAMPSDRVPLRMTAARLVREVEAFVDAAGDRAVHISELCNALRVSRRSLHRAFVETLNVGPVGYLRRRRLSTIQTILKRSDPAIPIADIAFEHGFPEPSRFSAYYRSLFRVTPSETRRSALR
jgi:AraC family ethanolamine operon transcriptional activator